ncbi:MAG: YceI family protein [Ignavibacteria bacterium]|jgi:polyisoprenoid-binding protein YceI
MKSYKIFFSILFLAFFVKTGAQTEWQFDKSHSTIGFSVTHMVITDVEGKFADYSGIVITNGDNFESAKINFTAKVGSIDTENTDRDNHLKGADFFNAEKYPELTFVGKSMKKVSDNKYKLTGDMTIKGVTKEIKLGVQFNGTVKGPWGNTRAGFKISGELNRFDFGLEWSELLETGGLVVGKEVTLDINVELIKKA